MEAIREEVYWAIAWTSSIEAPSAARAPATLKTRTVPWWWSEVKDDSQLRRGEGRRSVEQRGGGEGETDCESSPTDHLSLRATDRDVISDSEQTDVGLGVLGKVLLLGQSKVEHIPGVCAGSRGGESGKGQLGPDSRSLVRF